MPLGRELTLRSAKESDLDHLVHIKVDATRLFGSSYITEPLSKHTFDLFKADKNLWVVANQNDVPCGYAGAFPKENDLFLLHLFMQRDSAGMGGGTKLLDAVIAKAAAEERRAITLTTSGSAPWNAPYYARQGFKILNNDMPTYLRNELDDEIKFFSPQQSYVRENPLILPRVAMARLVS